MTDAHSSYRHVWPAVMAATDVEGAVTVLVQRYEQSGSQARDILRRTGLGTYWLAFVQKNWTATA